MKRDQFCLVFMYMAIFYLLLIMGSVVGMKLWGML